MTQPLARRIAVTLGRRIVAGELATGTVLGLEPLGEEFRVSRTVVREAVKILESHQLVASRRRVGVTVQPQPAWDALSPFVLRCRLDGPQRLEQLEQISQLRRGVEPVAAALAARWATRQQQQRLLAAATGMTTTAGLRPGTRADLQAYLDHDRDFHRTLLIASGNPLMGSLAGIVEEVLIARTGHHLMPDTPNPDAVGWHREVADAVVVGDADRAESVMRTIVEEARTAVAEMVGEPNDET